LLAKRQYTPAARISFFDPTAKSVKSSRDLAGPYSARPGRSWLRYGLPARWSRYHTGVPPWLAASPGEAAATHTAAAWSPVWSPERVMRPAELRRRPARSSQSPCHLQVTSMSRTGSILPQAKRFHTIEPSAARHFSNSAQQSKRRKEV